MVLCCNWVLPRPVTVQSGQTWIQCTQPPPRNQLENIEQALQQQDARFTGLEEVVRQVLAQLGNVTAAHTQAAAAAPSPAVTPPAPASPPLVQP